MTTSNALIYCRELITSGVPVQQALEQAMALEKAVECLATKEDIQNLDIKIDSSSATLNTKIDSSSALLNAKIETMQKWMIAFLSVILAVVLKVAIWG